MRCLTTRHAIEMRLFVRFGSVRFGHCDPAQCNVVRFQVPSSIFQVPPKAKLWIGCHTGEEVSLSSARFEGWAHRMGRSASVHTQFELVCVVACHPRLGHVTWVLCHLSVAISVLARVHLNVSQRARPCLVLTSWTSTKGVGRIAQMAIPF